MSERISFPPGFLFGAGTSAFQVEGGGLSPEPFSEWRQWEKYALPPHYRSDLSADHYNRYPADFRLAHRLSHNAHRFSLEWARIQPEQLKIDGIAIKHYKDKLRTLKEEGLSPFLALHHFANPAWFAKLGGWENYQAPKIFAEFVKRSAQEFGEYVDFWITLNEPQAYIMLAYLQLFGKFPPQKKSVPAATKVFINMVRAHRKAYEALKQEIPNAQVGTTNNVVDFAAFHHHFLFKYPEKLAAAGANLTNHLFYLFTKNTHDYLGLNYYVHLEYALGFPRLFKIADPIRLGREVSDMGTEPGWEIYPKGLYRILMDMKKYKVPIYVTENGIATHNDNQRARFIAAHLKYALKAISEGADVRGYFYWSFLECMELHRGYDPDFGLVAVDPRTKDRTPRPSAYIYKEIIDNNGIPAHLLPLADSFDRHDH